MKKIITCILTAGLVLSLTTATAFAAGNGKGCNNTGCSNKGIYCQYIDTDNDGICDRYHLCSRFVDENGDGICDNCNKTNNCTQNGTGKQRRQGCRNK